STYLIPPPPNADRAVCPTPDLAPDAGGAPRLPWLVEGETLLWWVKGTGGVNGLAGVVPVGDFLDSVGGRLENITPLAGRASSFDYGAQWGFRLGVAGYGDDDQRLGFD